MVKAYRYSLLFKSIVVFRFVDPVAQDIVSIKSFDGQWEVSTFRTIGIEWNLISYLDFNCY